MSYEFKPPEFCDNCGEPFPWLSREGLMYQLQNLLDAESLDPAATLEVREQLEALAHPDVPEEEQVRRWGRVKELAPVLWDDGQKILVNVVSEVVKKQLGL